MGSTRREGSEEEGDEGGTSAGSYCLANASTCLLEGSGKNVGQVIQEKKKLQSAKGKKMDVMKISLSSKQKKFPYLLCLFSTLPFPKVSVSNFIIFNTPAQIKKRDSISQHIQLHIFLIPPLPLFV